MSPMEKQCDVSSLSWWICHQPQVLGPASPVLAEKHLVCGWSIAVGSLVLNAANWCLHLSQLRLISLCYLEVLCCDGSIVLSPIRMVLSPVPSALTHAVPGFKLSWHLPTDVYLCQSGGWEAQLMFMVHYSPLHCRKESHFLLCFSLGNCNSTAQ